MSQTCGTKPLSKARIHLILYWCNAHNKDRQRLGQEERNRVEEGVVSKGKIARLAKLLNRILLLEGILVLMVLFLACAVYMLWKSLREVKEELKELVEDCETDGMMQLSTSCRS